MDKKTAKIIAELKLFKHKLSKQVNLQQMILFGSTARNKFRENSDLDLIFVSPRFNSMSPLKRAYFVSKYWDLNYPKDFLCYTPNEFKHLKKNSVVIKAALKEGIKI